MRTLVGACTRTPNYPSFHYARNTQNNLLLRFVALPWWGAIRAVSRLLRLLAKLYSKGVESIVSPVPRGAWNRRVALRYVDNSDGLRAVVNERATRLRSAR